MLIVGVVDEAADQGLGIDILIQLIPYILPRALMFAMPATCLFSVCVVFGRMAADHETVAIQTMGLHTSVIIFPALTAAFLLSLFAVWVNDVSFAWSYWGIERVVLESSDDIFRAMLESEGNIKHDKFSIEVLRIEDRKLIQPEIVFRTSKNKYVRVVAETATLTSDPENHSITFTMDRGAITMDGREFIFEIPQSFQIPLKSPEELAKLSGNPSHLYLHQIGFEVVQQEEDLDQIEKNNAIRACSQMITGDMMGLTNADWTSRIANQNEATQRLSRLHLVPHRRWANGFSCLAFAVIGIPVALRLKTANYAATFAVCFLPILFLYYPLLMFGLDGAKSGVLPPFAAWFGDSACFLVGGILLFREFKR